MTIIKGQIESLKEFPGQYGSMWSMTVNGTRYGLGKSNQGVSQGQWVEFQATQNAKGYWDVEKGSLQPSAAPTGAVQPTQQATYVDKRQDSIIYQSSRKDALHMVEIMQAAGLLDLGKGKNAVKMEILEHYVDSYTEHFVDETNKCKAFPSSPATAVEGDTVKAPAARFTDEAA